MIRRRPSNSPYFNLLASRSAATTAARAPVETTTTGSLRPRSSIVARRAIVTITAFSIKVRLPLFAAFSLSFFTGLAALIFEHSFAREANLARRIDVDNFHQQLLAFGQFVANVAHSIIGDL